LFTLGDFFWKLQKWRKLLGNFYTRWKSWINFYKNGLDYTLGHYSINSSGHPACHATCHFATLLQQASIAPLRCVYTKNGSVSYICMYVHTYVLTYYTVRSTYCTYNTILLINSELGN
jgi:hypothetical protein